MGVPVLNLIHTLINSRRLILMQWLKLSSRSNNYSSQHLNHKLNSSKSLNNSNHHHLEQRNPIFPNFTFPKENRKSKSHYKPLKQWLIKYSLKRLNWREKSLNRLPLKYVDFLSSSKGCFSIESIQEKQGKLQNLILCSSGKGTTWILMSLKDCSNFLLKLKIQNLFNKMISSRWWNHCLKVILGLNSFKLHLNSKIGMRILL